MRAPQPFACSLKGTQCMSALVLRFNCQAQLFELTRSQAAQPV